MHIKKRNVLRGVLTTTGILSLGVCLGAQKTATSPTLSESLVQLRAQQWTDRAKAYERLSSDVTALSNPKVQESLLDLLDRENQLIESTLRDSQEKVGVSAKYGEDYGEYVGELGETVDSFANWNDPHQVCIFVHESYNPESRFAAKVASNAKVAAPCLLQMYRSDVGLIRASAAAVLAQVLGKSGEELDSAMALTVRQTVLAALRDPVEVVRSSTVRELGAFGREDMIPALQQVAESDSAVSRTRGTFWIRQDAVKAIAEIRKRSAS